MTSIIFTRFTLSWLQNSNSVKRTETIFNAEETVFFWTINHRK